MDATDWRVIPAENLVASFQGSAAKLLAVATGAEDARLMLEALEGGTAGVILRTDDPAQARLSLALVRCRWRWHGVGVISRRSMRCRRLCRPVTA